MHPILTRIASLSARQKKFALGGAGALVLIALFSTGGEAPPANELATTAAEILPAITVSTVEPRLLRDKVLVSGLISPTETVLVAPLVEGQPIEVLLADVGDQVKAGQVLARLSTSTLDLQKTQILASLATARTAVAQAEAQKLEGESSAAEAARVAERTAKLAAQGSASQAAADQTLAGSVAASARATVALQSLDAAHAQVTLAEAQLANIELLLSRTEVKAPVDGLITARNAEVGAIATAMGQPLFTLIRDGALELAADVAEGDLPRLAPGQSATLTTVAGNTPIEATVRLVEPSVNMQTRLGRVRLAINAEGSLRAGMFADAEILVTKHDALAVPSTAVGQSEGESSVMRIRGDTVEQVIVTTGIRDGGWIEVLSGLAAGDVVVTRAGSFVRAGDRIRPLPEAVATN